jgi:hypothetical protein
MKSKMLFFAAGNFPMMNDPKAEAAMARRMLKRYGVYCRLVSFHYQKCAENVIGLKKIGISGIKIALDCGAFSANTQGVEINFLNYEKFIQKNLLSIDWYTNLDIIGNGPASYENFIRMKKAGLNPMPIFHLGTPKKFLQHYLEVADYIGISLRKKVSVPDSIVELDQLWSGVLTDTHGYPRAKYHLFGVSSARIISRYSWYSADGAGWALSSGFGSIFVPRQNRGLYCFSDTPAVVAVSERQEGTQRHFSNLGQGEKNTIENYTKSKCFQMSVNSSLNDSTTRDSLNLASLYDLAACQSKWPWPFRLSLDTVIGRGINVDKVRKGILSK